MTDFVRLIQTGLGGFDAPSSAVPYWLTRGWIVDTGTPPPARSGSKIGDAADLSIAGAAAGKVVTVSSVDGSGNPAAFQLTTPATGGSNVNPILAHLAFGG